MISDLSFCGWCVDILSNHIIKKKNCLVQDLNVLHAARAFHGDEGALVVRLDGGFHGGVTEDPDFQELLVRWFQFGTFCPVMRIHGNRGPREEIINKAGEVREGTGADNEVWSFGEKNYEILTKFIGVREKMRDYTRSLMAEAHEKGTPVMRTMFYEFPEDAACWDISDAYMFGSDILVAPIVRAKATSRTVYLPAGASWTLANTGDVYEGGKAYEIEAPIETLPIFLRDGKQGYLVGEI